MAKVKVTVAQALDLVFREHGYRCLSVETEEEASKFGMTVIKKSVIKMHSGLGTFEIKIDE